MPQARFTLTPFERQPVTTVVAVTSGEEYDLRVVLPGRRWASELASAGVAFTASAITGALIGLALRAVDDAIHPYAW